MRSFITVFLGLILALWGGALCAQKVKKAKVKPDFMLSIERVSCRGNCPGFVMTVDAKGTVDYNGSRNVKNIGHFTKTLSKTQMRELAGILEGGKIWSYNDVYDSENIADLPLCTVKYTHSGKTKEMRLRYKTPPELEALVKSVEAKVGDNAYQAAAETK